MKPRTKLQWQVLSHSNQLFDKRNEILKWASIDCLEHLGFMTKTRVVCMDCGGKFSPQLVKRKSAICPHCKTKLTVKQSRCTTHEQHIYVAKTEMFNEFQVIRHFEIFSHHKAGRSTEHKCCEVLQHWIHENGKREAIGRLHSLNYNTDSWNGKMEIRKEYNDYRGIKYDIYHHSIHPQSNFLPQYTKYGIDSNLKGLTILEAITHIPSNSTLETLLKSKQYALLNYFKERSGHRYWNAIKICIRNKYSIKDPQLWIDYIDLLIYFNKDLHNAHYVCPKNLTKEHDRYVKKKREIIHRRDEIEKRETALRNETQFKELKGNFFGIHFSDGDISIKVLESVSEYMAEGDTLKHCVFTNNYFLKKDTLCLSARIKNQPIETIEVSLSEQRILQARGFQNKASDHHDRIINIVQKNMSVITQRL